MRVKLCCCGSRCVSLRHPGSPHGHSLRRLLGLGGGGLLLHVPHMLEPLKQLGIDDQRGKGGKGYKAISASEGS